MRIAKGYRIFAAAGLALMLLFLNACGEKPQQAEETFPETTVTTVQTTEAETTEQTTASTTRKTTKTTTSTTQTRMRFCATRP